MTESTQQNKNATIWPILTYRDAGKALIFLTEAFGFEKTAEFADETQPEKIMHAEMRWPDGGGIMLGTTGAGSPPFSERIPGNDCVYVVCEDPDALFERATAAGAEVVRAPADQSYGSREFAVRDPEGNLWSFGTYAGE